MIVVALRPSTSGSDGLQSQHAWHRLNESRVFIRTPQVLHCFQDIAQNTGARDALHASKNSSMSCGSNADDDAQPLSAVHLISNTTG